MKTKSTRKANCAGVIDLFGGVGGLGLGAARAGFTLKATVDLDPQAVKAHRQNFPHCAHLETDVSRLKGSKLLREAGLKKGKLQGVIGGPPCQGFSVIGHRNGSDPRNLQFVHFFRIVAETKPKFFLAENVPGIMSADYTALRSQALSMIEDEYDVLPPLRLNASDFGAPTKRERVFFIGFCRDEMPAISAESFNAHGGIRKVRVREALKGLPKKIDPAWQSEEDGWQPVGAAASTSFGAKLRGHVPDGVGDSEALSRLRRNGEVSGCLGTLHTGAVVRRFSRVEQGHVDKVSKARRLESNGFCPTLRAGTDRQRGSFQAVRPLHPTENRVITPREAARLQGFPDWYQFSPTKWHGFRQIGNSVSPILAESIFRVISRALGIQ